MDKNFSSKGLHQYELARAELLSTQQQMDKYDSLSTTAKTWAVTLWVASIGWSFQAKRPEFALIGAVAVFFFWILDSLNKTFRQGYKKRREEVVRALECFFRTGSLPDDFTSPCLPSHRWTDALRYMLALHIALPYIVLIVISLVIY